MRIAVNTRFLLPGRMEGIGRFTWEVVRRLVDRFPNDEFLFLFDRPFDPAYVPSGNIHPIVVAPPARHPLLWYAWFEWAVPRVLRHQRADVFFSPDGYCSLRSTAPTVMVTHDLAHIHFPEAIPFSVRTYYQHYVPLYLQRAGQVVAVSEYTARDIMHQYSIPSEKISIACNGCDPAFRPLAENEKQSIREQYARGLPYFFYVGAMHPRKNLPRLIAAFDRFKAQTGSPALLLLAGRLAWQTGEIRSAFDTAAHRNDIVFMGYVPDEALPSLTGAALALTYVSLFEGFGVPLLEALHCETPVLYSDVSSMPEVAGPAGLPVNPHSEISIAEGMSRLWHEPALRRQLTELAAAQRAKFSWERAADVVAGALREVM